MDTQVIDSKTSIQPSYVYSIFTLWSSFELIDKLKKVQFKFFLILDSVAINKWHVSENGFESVLKGTNCVSLPSQVS